jgi:hypothetical protein
MGMSGLCWDEAGCRANSQYRRRVDFKNRESFRIKKIRFHPPLVGLTLPT